MQILLKEKQAELVVKKSRFIAIACVCNSISDVKLLVDKTRKMHPNANHVVHAAVVGNQFSFSDDKEPKGTAGRPVFEVLKGSGISNICLMVVRYFGGTLLGTGGLVKAYGDAAKLVLSGIETEEYVEKLSFCICADYSFYEGLRRVVSSFNAAITSESFENGVQIKGLVPKDNAQSFKAEVTNCTKSRCKIIIE